MNVNSREFRRGFEFVFIGVHSRLPYVFYLR